MLLCRIGPNETQSVSETLYRIEIPEDKNNTVYYCRERLEQNIRDFISGMKELEIRVVLDVLIKKGVLVTQPNTPAK